MTTTEPTSLNLLNAFFKTNKDFALYIEKHKNIILLKADDSAITTSYLLKVASDQVLTISTEKFKHFRGKIQKFASKHNYINSFCKKQEKIQVSRLVVLPRR